jgi:hypothetical protein
VEEASADETPAEVASTAEDVKSAPAEAVTVCMTVTTWTLVAMLISVTVIAAVGQMETGEVLFSRDVGLTDGIDDKLPVGVARLLVTFNELLGVTEGAVVMLAEDTVAGTVEFRDPVEILTDAGGLEIPVKVTDLGVELADKVELTEPGGIDVETPVLVVELGTTGTEEFADGKMLPVNNVAELGSGKGVRNPSELVPGVLDLETEEMFALRLGVALGSAGADELVDGTMLPLLGTDGELNGRIRVPIDEMFMLRLGVALGSTGTDELADGTMLPLLGTERELDDGIGKGVRRSSELVPGVLDLETEEMFMLRLGVALGSTGTDELADGTMLPLLGTERELDDGIGKGVRRSSELVPGVLDLETEEMFMLRLGVALGSTGTDELADGTMLPLLGTERELDDGIGKGVRRSSELVPGVLDLEIEEMFMLRLGVALGNTGADELADGTMLPLLGADKELDEGMGKGVRRPSELVPGVLDVEEIFKLRLGVTLGGTTTEEFAEGSMTLLLACEGVVETFALDNIVETTGCVELDISGADEFTIGKVEEVNGLGTGVDIGIEEFPKGGTIPLLPVADDVAVLPWTVVVLAPLDGETRTLGVVTGLRELLAVEFPDDGGTRPDARVEKAVPVDPDVEKIPVPDETVTLGNDPDVVRSGGISPDKAVELTRAVKRDVENTALPTDTFKLVMISVTGGGIKLCELMIVVVVVDVKIFDIIAVPPDGVT